MDRPTPDELDALRARIVTGNRFAAAKHLGVSQHTIRNRLDSLFAKVGAVSTANAAYLCWRYIAPSFTERRSGRPRRASDREEQTR